MWPARGMLTSARGRPEESLRRERVRQVLRGLTVHRLRRVPRDGARELPSRGRQGFFLCLPPAGESRGGSPVPGGQGLLPGRSDRGRRMTRTDQPRERKYSMVLFSPSSNGTFVSHPRRAFAFVMSGWRTFGSSTGRGLKTMGAFVPVNL